MEWNGLFKPLHVMQGQGKVVHRRERTRVVRSESRIRKFSVS